MQTVTVDDHGSVLINAAAAGGGQQLQQLQLPNGQTILTRAPSVLPSSNIPAGLQTGLLQNLAGQTVQFPGGEKCISNFFKFMHSQQ